MENKQITVIVDADAIVAQTNIDDSNHKKAISISEYLASVNANVLYPASAVFEATTVIQSKMNSLATAISIANTFTKTGYSVVDIDQNIYNKAVNEFFSKVTNKRDTLFDCVVATVAKENDADYIFSFDKFYEANFLF